MKTLLLTDPMPQGQFTAAIRAMAPDVTLLERRADISDAELASVEADLIAAARSGHRSEAALDVQHREPMPPNDPLWVVPGITITPHIAAQSSAATIARQFVAGLRCLQRGKAAPQLIDRARGY